MAGLAVQLRPVQTPFGVVTVRGDVVLLAPSKAETPALTPSFMAPTAFAAAAAMVSASERDVLLQASSEVFVTTSGLSVQLSLPLRLEVI